MYKVIVDTNLLVSFLISKTYSKLDPLITSKKVKLVFSKESLSEFIDVVSRPKLKKYFELEDVAQLIEYIEEYSEVVHVKSQIKKCRDEKDNFLLALAIDSKADYLLTGDKDLLVIKKIKQTEIVTITQFLKQNS